MSFETLYNTNRIIRQDTFRNIVSLRESQDLFDDLNDGDPELSAVAIEVEMQVKQTIPNGFISRGYYYSTAIGYPFETQPFMHGRFGDGSFGVWYGALESETTIYETVYHMLRTELGIEHLDEVVIRERAVYRVHCNAVLCDLTGKCEEYPQLLGNDYSFTQQIAKELQRQGHPGLVAKSARCEDGANIAVFNESTLSNARSAFYLTYYLDPRTKTVRVERMSGEHFLIIDGSNWL